jgi:hypothetical protein
MRRLTNAFLFAASAIALAGCSNETTADSATTTTTMDAVDVVQGTISDEMIASDAITEQAPTAEGDEDSTDDGAAPKKGNDSKSASDKKAKPKTAVPARTPTPAASIPAQPNTDAKPQ